MRILIIILLLSSVSCRQAPQNTAAPDDTRRSLKGALLLTKFNSLDELKAVVQIEYAPHGEPMVRLTHSNNGRKVTSILTPGISQLDFMHARQGSFWDRVWLALRCPYAVVNRRQLQVAYILARRLNHAFGEGDVAFYDLAETMMYNISLDDFTHIPSENLSEKGYINTFNHITAQAFTTSIFSEELADFIADIHERYNMPELISGVFTEEQLSDLETGPVDNYVDMINNEWGQELGKVLRSKYQISTKTYWTPELLTDYLNDIQSYYSWVFGIGFEPFCATDDLVTKFSSKINRLIESLSGIEYKIT